MTNTNIQIIVDEAFEKYHQFQGGKNADYIPYLANVPSNFASVCVMTTDGAFFGAGDKDFRFAIESISKVCTLALALEETDPKTVQDKIGTSPTGLPFNSVMALELHKDKPLSPLVNAGAMATVSLLKAENAEQRWKKILAFQQRLCSQDVQLSEEVNHSEQTTNAHNKAIAWLLYSAHNLYCDPMEACDVYTRQCSTLVSTRDLATFAVTLANGGVNPITKERVIKASNIPPILAEMMMEGLYDSSGKWAYHVGLPAKSGVGGGLFAVVPGVMGIAAFSPPLDKVGNSVRAQKMISYIAQQLHYNLFNVKYA